MESGIRMKAFPDSLSKALVALPDRAGIQYFLSYPSF